jgi:hypothetical protein
MSALKLPLIADLKQEIGELVFFPVTSSLSYFIKYFKVVYIKTVVKLTLTTGVMFLLFTCTHFWVWGIYEGSPRMRRPLMK